MSDKVVVRYAPSPTGPQHIGGIRTALYCYFFAKKMGGEFILRIEDTDQERFVPGAEEYIIESCKWLGLEFSQGVHLGGPHAPYRQSERSELYRKYAQQLIDSGHAYYAFDTREEIDEMRERMIAAGNKGPQYNFITRGQMKNSLTLSEEEVQQRIKNGDPYVIRLKVPNKEEVRFHDLVRDWVVIHSSHVDDKVLLKSDGLPTYHLANVVDDHHMGVTHVIRGEEWLPSTPLHVLLYRAFGWEDTMPEFAHLPLILKPDVNLLMRNKNLKKKVVRELPELFQKAHPEIPGNFRSKIDNFLQQAFRDPTSFVKNVKENEKDDENMAALRQWVKERFYGKLSKRDGDLLGFPVFPLNWKDPKSGEIFEGYRELGYLPEAFMNYMALLGWNPGTEEEIMDRETLIETFSLDRVNKAGAKFDPEKIRHFNEVYLRAKKPEEWVDWVKNALKEAGKPVPESDEYLAGVIGLLQERITFPQQFLTFAPYFFEAPQQYDEKLVSKSWDAEAASHLKAMAEDLDSQTDWNAAGLESSFNAYLEKNDLGLGKAMKPLRLSVTGLGFGPGIFEIMELLGREESLKRINHALEQLGS